MIILLVSRRRLQLRTRSFGAEYVKMPVAGGSMGRARPFPLFVGVPETQIFQNVKKKFWHAVNQR